MSIFGFSFSNKKQTQIGRMYIDVLETETLSLPGEVTKYPIEDGTQISDHIFLNAETLNIDGKISHSTGRLFDLSGIGNDSTKLIDAVTTLREIKAERELVTITTGLATYTDMGIASIKFTRSASAGGNWIDISIEAVKVKKVHLRTAEIPRAARPTAGRTGASNRPAGRSTPSGAGAEQYGPNRQVSAAARLADTGAALPPNAVLGNAARLLGGVAAP